MSTGSFVRWGRMSLAGFTLAFCAVVGAAQVDTGSILGTVTDKSGAIVPGATVTITSKSTASQQSTKTSQDGRYDFTPIKIGDYKIEVESPGFKKVSIVDVHLDIQQQVLENIALEPGTVNQTTEVTAGAELMQTQSGSVGQVIEEKTVQNLPLNGRDYTMLALLTPGVTIPQQGARASNQFVANGTRTAQNNYLLDGIDNNSNSVDFLDGAADVVKPPVDAIAEFKVMTSSFPAEFGRAGGAIVNATLRSGSNQIHFSAWEFFRNDALDAYSYFADAKTQRKPTLQQNQFGGTFGWRIFKDRTFVFGDYEGTRKSVGNLFNGVTVPTAAEVSSGFTDFQDLIGATGSFTRTDLLGRTFQNGQIFDPATTRSVTKGVIDPVSGLPATDTGYVRDSFANNQIPADRLDANAIKLLQLFPAATAPGVLNNYSTIKSGSNHTNTADVRVDHKFSQKDQMFGRYSYITSTRIVPPPFGGIADGGGYGAGLEINKVNGLALSYTHVFSPTLVNEVRFGLSIGHDTRNPAGDTVMGIPAQFGIAGVPQLPLNGGLPYLGIGTLSALGGSGWLPGDRYSDTKQITENLTKVYKRHTMKGGAEFQYIYFPWLAPPASKGNFYWDGNFTSVPQQTDGSTGRAQFLINPERATVPNGVDYSGGLDSIAASNFGKVHADRNYFGTYFQDDWAITSKLTLNLGLRWEHFGLTGETTGAQANFVAPSRTSNQGAQFIMTASHKSNPPLSSSFTDALAKDGIALVFSDQYGTGMGIVQKTNFAPRLGFAYSISPKLVLRGGYGIFYGAFENRGGYPSLGYNYPFQFEASLADNSNGGISTVTPVIYANGTTGTLENGMSGIDLNTATVSYSGLQLRGIQLKYQTPYTEGYNLVLQYQVMQHDSVEAAYVGSQARHLEASSGQNEVTGLLPPGTPTNGYIPFPDFGAGMPYYATAGNSGYNSLQTKWIHRASNGLDMLLGYTFAQVRTDAGDSLSNGGLGGYRAPSITGIAYDTGLASFNIKHQFVASGSYVLPIGRNKAILGGIGRVADLALGGWSTNAILTLDTGQPQTIGSQISTGSGTSANAVVVPGVSRYRGAIAHYYNPAAFKDPPVVQTIGQGDLSPLGGPPTQVNGPGYKDFDFSLFKNFSVTERSHAEFRAEAFNLTNTPSFSLPSNGNYKDDVHFGQITSTQGAARILQLAVKFLW